MRKIAALFYMLVLCCRVQAQQDSVALLDRGWSYTKLAPGVSWRSARFAGHELFNANENINIIVIAPGSAGARLCIAHSDSLETTSQIAKAQNALAAVNGSFFKMRGADPDDHRELNGVPKLEPSKLDRNRSIVYLREKNTVLSENISDKDSTRKRHQQGSIAINNGIASILNADRKDLNWERGIVAQDVLSSGPVMLLGGADQPIPDDAFCRDRHPRTAIGKKRDGTVLLFTVDGRTPESAGMSIPELQQTLRWLGCVDAINLDGGGSTTMYVKGQPDGGVVNYPTDNKRFDHLGEREVANAVLLLPQKDAVSQPDIDLTLVPPGEITDKVDLDIRAGIKNNSDEPRDVEVCFYLGAESATSRLYRMQVTVPADSAKTVKFIMPTGKHRGKNRILLVVKGKGFTARMSKTTTIVPSKSRSTKTIGGAWISFYHWSETEGKMWNPIIQKLTDDQWREMIASMHAIGMDIVVIQESFRNQEYVGQKTAAEREYKGKAYYPSALFPGRMPIVAKDPIEAVLSEADRLGMHVFAGVGMYAWFDYTAGSLEWHKKVAKELWDRYGRHSSFYGFYVSEEGMGSLDCFEKDSSKLDMRRQEVLDFFKAFTPYCNHLAPGKPVMFAPNGWGVGRAKGAYAELLKNVDIISPFAFARMPKGDLSGREAIALLQRYCNEAHAHLWLDQEAFLFNEKEHYLYPRPMKEIKQDLEQFSTFEKVISYQYPGVFNDPHMSVRVGEASTVQLYKDYQHYLDSTRKR